MIAFYYYYGDAKYEYTNNAETWVKYVTESLTNANEQRECKQEMNARKMYGQLFTNRSVLNSKMHICDMELIQIC